MAFPSDTRTYTAAGTITALQCVQINADGEIIAATGGTGQVCDGIAQVSAVVGDAIDVVVYGSTKATAGGALTAGTNRLLMVETGTGHLINWVGGATNFTSARWFPNQNQTSASAGEEINVIFTGADANS